MSTDNNELVHCIYTSAAVHDFNEDDVLNIAMSCRNNNQALDITGMLLFSEGSFFQVLEGPSHAVQKLFEKIQQDKRHDRVAKLILEPIEQRDFSHWSMGYAGVSRDELKAIPGLNDFFSTRRCYLEMDEGRAKTLLNAFREGRWRSTLQ
jgi:hypothetical protein